MNGDEVVYQTAAQDVRAARDTMDGVEEKSLGDWLALVGLGVIEGYLSDKHEDSGTQST